MSILTSRQWSLVLAGISDFARPAEKLSLTQNFALTCTGLIWTRWCFVIRPKNMLYGSPSSPSARNIPPSVTNRVQNQLLTNRRSSLAAVNFFLALVGITQLTRIGLYEASKKGSASEAIADVKESVQQDVAQAKAEVKEIVKN